MTAARAQSGRSVSQAFDNAVRAVRGDPRTQLSTEHRKFQLLPVGADHSEVVFPLTPRRHGQMEIDSSLQPSAGAFRCRPPCRRLVGRFRLLQMMLSRLPRPAMRLLQLYGTSGAGKTLVAHWLAEHLVRRRRFRLITEVNFEVGPGSGDDVQSQLCTAICGPSPAQGGEMQALTALRHEPILLVVDGVPPERAAETARAIVFVLQHLPLLKVVVTSGHPVMEAGGMDMGFEVRHGATPAPLPLLAPALAAA